MLGEYQEPVRSNFILKGIVISNLFYAAAAGIIGYVENGFEFNSNGVIIFSEFTLIPICMGIIASKYWIREQAKLSSLSSMVLINTIVALVLSAFFMGEGVICLIIVSPLIFAFMWIGVIIGKYIFINKNSTLKSSTFLVFLVLFIYDTFSDHNYTNVVSDEITINAPKEVVWKYIASHPVNTESPEYWLFKIGLPYPVQSTVSGLQPGSNRKCIFSNNAVFDETVVENIHDRIFTFDIVKQPEDPEIIGHIDIQRGQFILIQNPDGTTKLIGNSWYKLKVFPIWYYDFWAIDITRNVHIRVMNHIKKLAENDCLISIEQGRFSY